MDAVYYPFETIKSRIQASSSKVNFAQTAKGRSLFAGFSTICYVSFPGTALYFLGYDGTMAHIRKNHKGFSENGASVISAFVAELFCNSFRNPFEVIKQQMQIGLDKSVYETSRNIVRSKGWKGRLVADSQASMLALALSCSEKCRTR